MDKKKKREETGDLVEEVNQQWQNNKQTKRKNLQAIWAFGAFTTNTC